MSVPDLQEKVFVVYEVLTGGASIVTEEEAEKWREMIAQGVMGVVVYEGAISWTEHGPVGSREFTPK